MNLSVLKSLGFWIALLSAVFGVTLSQNLVVPDSVFAEGIGWILTFLGAGGAGHQVAAVKQLVA